MAPPCVRLNAWSEPLSFFRYDEIPDYGHVLHAVGARAGHRDVAGISFEGGRQIGEERIGRVYARIDDESVGEAVAAYHYGGGERVEVGVGKHAVVGTGPPGVRPLRACLVSRVVGGYDDEVVEHGHRQGSWLRSFE